MIETPQRLFEPPGLRQCKTEIGVPAGISRFDRDGAPDQFDGRGCIARLQFGDPKQMQGGSIVRMTREDLTVDCRSFGNIALAMQGKRVLQRLTPYLARPRANSEIRCFRLRDRDFVFVEIIAVVVFRADILGIRDRLVVQDEALPGGPFARECAGILDRHRGQSCDLRSGATV